MEPQKLIILGTAIVVIGGGVWFFTTKTNTDDTQATMEQDMSLETAGEEFETTDETALQGDGSLFDLLALGRSISCTYTYTDENGEGKGTGYFDGRRMRVDSTFTHDGQTFDSHVINDGENMYSWTISSEGSFAFVTPSAEYENESDIDTMPMQENTGREALDQRVTYECDGWRVDESRFAPPRDIEFMDMNAMMEGMMEGMPEGMMENMPQFN